MTYRFYKIEYGSSALNLRLLRRSANGQWEELQTYGWIQTTAPNGHTPITLKDAERSLIRLRHTRPGMQDTLTTELQAEVMHHAPVPTLDAPMPRVSDKRKKQAKVQKDRQFTKQLAMILGVSFLGLLALCGVVLLVFG